MLKKKIQSPRTLAKILKKSGGKTVFTNGVFDILHKGHVTYLEKARALGDILIVALNTDESTRRLKGPQRPVNKLEDRLAVIAALESVSYVTWFGDDVPTALVKTLRPRVLVKGADYSPTAAAGPKFIEGSREVLGWGGKVRVIRMVPGKSTTSILSKVSGARTKA
jgi:rfaE bifunctional protein nucleotidyltransferase chain/domain